MASRCRSGCIVLMSVVSGFPIDCNITDDLDGQMQVWVPDCQGTGCLANGLDMECAWHVHDMAKCRATHGDVCHETAAARKAQRVHGEPVSQGSYNVDGYVCGGTTTEIWYPGGAGPYPVLIYLHGEGGGDDDRGSQFASVAASGFVVVVPKTGGYPGSCDHDTEYEDAVTAWSASKSGGAGLSAGLAKVDWTKTGIWGYSMGGKATPEASAQSVMGVGAAVCSHDARKSDELTVPALYITGTEDDMSSPPAVMSTEFDEALSTRKVLANLQGGEHTWPITRGTMTPWIAKFFACALSSESDDCNAVYGSGPGSLCAANNYANCTVVQPSQAIV